MSAGDGQETEHRRRVLTGFGARGEVVGELLAYDSNVVTTRGWPPLPTLPLADEPNVEAWRRYAADAEHDGVLAVLRRTFPQLRFPVRAGMSQEDAYRAATLRGAESDRPGAGAELREPNALELILHSSVAGTVPIIVTGAREDFVTLVRAFCHRNEPSDVPLSMGACHVAGLNNWERIRTYRQRWEQEKPGAHDADSWSEEFGRLRTRKQLYQDRFVILSRGPYSAVPATEIGMDDTSWLSRSLVIRRDHECAHAFTLRTFGSLQNNLLEELLADFAGLIGAFGGYREDLARRFLGLESFPAYRTGGRLENYRGTPPLSDPAFTVLTALASAAIGNLAGWCESHPETASSTALLARSLFVLTGMTLEELAAPDFAERVEALLVSFDSR